MTNIVIKNLPNQIKSLEIDYNKYSGEDAKNLYENIVEFIGDIELSKKIKESSELNNVLRLIDNKI